MAQAYIDSITMETLGQASFMQNCVIDHIAIEVLGYFVFGSIGIEHVVMEVLGKTSSFANVEHVVMEVIGQWAGF